MMINLNKILFTYLLLRLLDSLVSQIGLFENFIDQALWPFWLQTISTTQEVPLSLLHLNSDVPWSLPSLSCSQSFLNTHVYQQPAHSPRIKRVDHISLSQRVLFL